MKIYTQIADDFEGPTGSDISSPGIIERAATRPLDTVQEGRGQRMSCRVAWRRLGTSEEDDDSKWMISCRTPNHLFGGLEGASDQISDGSDEAMVKWLTEKVER